MASSERGKVVYRRINHRCGAFDAVSNDNDDDVSAVTCLLKRFSAAAREKIYNQPPLRFDRDMHCL